ncbi:MAG: outer membrane beta-barrel protein [Gammaproteobacteria bacterium]
MKNIFSLLILVVTIWALPATAQQRDPVKGWYTGAGLGIGTVLAQDDDDWFTDTSYGDPDLAWVVTGGYRFGRYFALEASYFDLGEPEYDDNLVEVREFNDIVDVDVDVDITVTQLTAVGILPFKIGRNVRAEFFFRGGAAFWDADSEQEIRSRTGGPTVRRTLDDDDLNFVFGFGGGLSFGKHWHLRLDYSNFAIEDDLLVLDRDNDAYADTTTFQLHYRFGDNWSY